MDHMVLCWSSLAVVPHGPHGAMLLIPCCGTPWTTWCYAAHPLLWCPKGHMVLCCSSLAVAPHGPHGAMLVIPCCGTPWTTWCYAVHPLLWHPMDHMVHTAHPLLWHPKDHISSVAGCPPSDNNFIYLFLMCMHMYMVSIVYTQQT